MQWNRIYNGYETQDLIQTADGGYAIAGMNATYTLRGYNYFLPMLIKTTSLGEIEWGKTYDSKFGVSREAFSVVQTRDLGYLLSGRGGWVLKVNSHGDIQWNKTFGFSLIECYAIQTSNGDFVLSGLMTNNNNGEDALVFKIDAMGNLLWNKEFSDPSVQFVAAGKLVETTDQNYAFVGNWGNYAWFAQISSTGDLQINQTYQFSSNGGNSFFSIAKTNDGGYVVTGNDRQSVWLAKLDSEGTIQWSQPYQGKSFRVAVQAPDGGYIAGGGTLLKVNATGRIEWSNVTSGVGTTVIVTNDGGYAAAGFESSSNGDMQEVWVIKFASESAILPDGKAPLPDESSPFPTIWIVVAVIIVATAGIGLLVYLKKYKH